MVEIKVTELFDDAGHLTGQGIEVLANYCLGEESLPTGMIWAVQEHIGLFAGSQDFRECRGDCQERVLSALGSEGKELALVRGLFTYALP